MQRYRVRTAAGERNHLHHGVLPEHESACRIRIPGTGRAVTLCEMQGGRRVCKRGAFRGSRRDDWIYGGRLGG